MLWCLAFIVGVLGGTGLSIVIANAWYHEIHKGGWDE